MKISELLEELGVLQGRHGDLDVYLGNELWKDGVPGPVLEEHALRTVSPAHYTPVANDPETKRQVRHYRHLVVVLCKEDHDDGGM